MTLTGFLTAAAVSLAPVFSDHAVLQRGKRVPVWGRGAVGGERLTARVGGASAVTVANGDGTFRFWLAAQPAGGPFTLEVTDSTGGVARASDVWFGEVWLASGQSNMARHMRDAWPQLEGDRPMVREFVVRRSEAARPLDFGGGEWYRAEGSAVKNFSAVGAFFAAKISEELGGVAVGVLNASEGGTTVEQWSSAEALADSECGARALENSRRRETDPRRFDKTPPAVPDTGISEAARKWPERGFDDSKWTCVELPNDYWHAFKCKPFNGAVWFRRRIKLPEGWRGRDLELGVGQIDKSDVTWVDGVRVGGLGGGDDPTYYDTPRIYPVRSERDEIQVAIRVWSYAAGGGVYGDADEMFLRLRDDRSRSVPIAGTWLAAVERDIGARDCPDVPPAPAALFNGMIAPLVPYAMRGVIWYQGCSGGGVRRGEYRGMQNAMVRDWRRRWGERDMPFACVLLAGVGPRRPYVERGPGVVRIDQVRSSLDLPHAGCASAVDAGDENDIHPKDKKTVGERLARWALVEAYGRPGAGCGPRFKSAEASAGAITARFTDVGGGLVAKDSPGGAVRGVYIAGADRKFVPAEARIAGDTVVARAAGVDKPLYIRYAWSPFPSDANLWNADGLPAACFTNEE